MTTKMVANFRRSVSFSTPPPPPSTTRSAGKKIHFRSTSLPTRSHPILSQLKSHLIHFKSHWGSDPKSEPLTSARILESLLSLHTILDLLDDLLDLPPSRDTLRRHPHWVEKVLEDFLRMVDLYGTFQMQISSLKQCHVAAQLAIRRRDGLKSGFCLKDLKKTGQEIGRLMPVVHGIGQDLDLTGSDPDMDLAVVIAGVVEIILMISEALFVGVSGSFLTRKTPWIPGLKSSSKPKREKGIKELECGMWSLRNKENDINGEFIKNKMKEMEECINGIESGSERVFKGLINARVSLLNVLTQ